MTASGVADQPGPSDGDARTAIVDALDRTLLVEAAAGTGKTRSMVDRVVALVTTGRARISEVAAITFTDAAAAELRERIRLSLERVVDDPAAPPAVLERARGALRELDEAAISTLHGFAARILSDHPFEAGLPPSFEVLDDVAAWADFGTAWDAFFDDVLDDPELEPVLRRALAAGLAVGRIREVALALHEHWDRVEATVVEPPRPARADAEPVLGALRTALDGAAACTDESDRLYQHLDRVRAFAERLAVAGDELEVLGMLRNAPRLGFKGGNRQAWPDGAKERVLDRLRRADEARAEVLGAVGRWVLLELVHRVRAFVREAAAERRRGGRLGFHDLLVLSRDLLRDHEEIRRLLHERFRFVYIDEFQDTDPLQIELAALLVHEGAPGAPAPPWPEAQLDAGRLFVVGDPKQSIYRFRRADIRLYHHVRRRLARSVVSLTTNFRSEPSILEWVNHAFANLMDEEAGVQASYVAMDAQRPPASDGPRVRWFGGPSAEAVSSIRAREAEELAQVLASGLGAWTVEGPSGPRPACFGDVAVLVPTRRTLPDLERALDASGVPYRVEARSLLFGTQEVRDLLNVLQAADDPTDEIAVVAALRTPALGCPDDALLSYRRAGGRWNPLDSPPSELPGDHPVVEAMGALRRLHEVRTWASVSQIVEQVVRERGMLELAATRKRPRDHWRRIHFVVDQARAFSDRGGRTLRQFLMWARQQAEEGASVNEALVAEPDDDAVRILTVHGSKGLEFPVVFLSGLNTVDRPPSPTVLWGDDGRLAVRLGARETPFQTESYAELVRAETAAEAAERIRLLYVAATRARDHLVLSLHHKDATVPNCHAARLLAACLEADHLWAELAAPPEATRLDGSEVTAAPVHPVSAQLPGTTDRDVWLARRQALLAAGSRAPVVAATTLAGDLGGLGELPGSEPVRETGQAVEAPWRRGRAGTAVGRAVHATLQSVDLATGGGVVDVARAQAVAEGVAARAPEVERLARAALDAPVVRQAVASGRFWREVSIGVPLGGTTVEGYVDLLAEGPNGLVVVDYKTDRIDEGDELSPRYRIQGAAYSAALEEALGRPVTRCVFVFVGRGTAREVEVEDLPEAVAEVRSLLAQRT